MIGHLLRTVPVGLRAKLKPRSLVSVVHRRVRPSEMDNNRHMNQAVYAQVFELGRVDWFVSTDAWGTWRRQGMHPVVGRQTLTYRRELKLGRRYRIDTRATHVDGRLLAMQGVISIDSTVHALCDAMLLLIGPDGVLGPEATQAASASLLTDAVTIEDWSLVRS